MIDNAYYAVAGTGCVTGGLMWPTGGVFMDGGERAGVVPLNYRVCGDRSPGKPCQPGHSLGVTIRRIHHYYDTYMQLSNLPKVSRYVTAPTP
jgi:hypothetical protein